VTVAVIQALVRWEPSKLDAFLGGFGLLILDEAHHVAASTFHSVVDRCPARYRLGLTATPEREDGLTALLDLFLGAPLVTVTHDELVAAGVLTVPDIHSVETDFTYLYTGAEDYAPMLAAVASDPRATRSSSSTSLARPAPATSASCSPGASTTATRSPRPSRPRASRRRCSPGR
jgi:superfamily II DNA or RNA helicase